MLFESSGQICRILNRGALSAVVFILQEKKQSYPDNGNNDSCQEQRPMPDEPLPKLFKVCHLMDATDPQGHYHQ